MSLIEDISGNVAGRVAGVVFAAAAAVGLSGCAAMDGMGEMGERVLTHSFKRGSFDVRTAVGQAIKDPLRVTPCRIATPTAPVGRDAPLGDKLENIWQRNTEITTGISVGDTRCSGTTGLVPAPVVNNPTGRPAVTGVQPRPQR